MPVAYSYIRFSTPDQIKGDSLRRQIEASHRYATEHNLTLDETLNVRDLGVSAFSGMNFERGALGQFIVAIDNGRVAPDSYLLMESLDRLSRLPDVNTPEQLATMADELLKTGYDEDRVAAHITSMPTKPDRQARFFIAHLHNGVRRTVINGKILENRPYRSIRALVDRVRSEAIADGRLVAEVAT